MTKNLIAVAALLALTACSTGTRFVSSTNGYLDRTHGEIAPTTKIFVVENASAENKLLEAEVAHYAARLIEEQGYDVVQDADDADMLVLINYGIGDPRQVSTVRAVYVPGKTTTIQSASGVTVGSAKSTGSVGYVPGSRSVYDRWLMIGAYDNQTLTQDEEVVEVWRGETTSTGWSGDLRRVLPYMLVPAIEHFGTNTGQGVRVTVPEKDGRIRALVGEP